MLTGTIDELIEKINAHRDAEHITMPSVVGSRRDPARFPVRKQLEDIASTAFGEGCVNVIELIRLSDKGGYQHQLWELISIPVRIITQEESNAMKVENEQFIDELADNQSDIHGI